MKKAEYREKVLKLYEKYEDHPGYQYVLGYAPNKMLADAGFIEPHHFKVLVDAVRVTLTPEEFELLTTEDYRKL